MDKTQSSKRYDLGERTLKFAKRVRGFIKIIPRTLAITEDSKQLIRSSGSVGANYIEAEECLSKKDFIMRIKICRKEAKESIYWLELLEHEHANVIGQCFNEFPASRLTKRSDRLADGKIVNGLSQVVGCSACPEVVGQLDGDEKSLRLRSFLVRHANMKPNLQVLDSDTVRHRRELLRWPLRRRAVCGWAGSGRVAAHRVRSPSETPAPHR